MKRFTKSLLILWLAGSLHLIGCSDDDPAMVPNENGVYAQGILVTNEGPFNNGSGTIDFIRNDFSETRDAIFKRENGSDLGNVVQSLAFSIDNAYIVVNNSHLVQVVDRYSFKHLGTVSSGLENPRFLTLGKGKGYVTNWGDPNDPYDDYIAVIDLTDFVITNKIPVGEGPEAILMGADLLYVAQKGGYGVNHTITVIDPTTETVVKTIAVGDVPTGFLPDGKEQIWVLCQGAPAYSGTETGGTLNLIDTHNNTVVKTLAFGDTEHPGQITGDANTLYYTLADAVYAMDIQANSLPSEPILEGEAFYAIAVRDGLFFGTDAKDYNSRGELHVYDLGMGNRIQNLSVGIIPGGIYFNP